jgi:hypothetical protein
VEVHTKRTLMWTKFLMKYTITNEIEIDMTYVPDQSINLFLPQMPSLKTFSYCANCKTPKTEKVISSLMCRTASDDSLNVKDSLIKIYMEKRKLCNLCLTYLSKNYEYNDFLFIVPYRGNLRADNIHFNDIQDRFLIGGKTYYFNFAIHYIPSLNHFTCFIKTKNNGCYEIDDLSLSEGQKEDKNPILNIVLLVYSIYDYEHTN